MYTGSQERGEETSGENGARERVSDRGGGTAKVATSAGRPTSLENSEQTKLPEILMGNEPQSGTEVATIRQSSRLWTRGGACGNERWLRSAEKEVATFRPATHRLFVWFEGGRQGGRRLDWTNNGHSARPTESMELVGPTRFFLCLSLALLLDEHSCGFKLFPPQG